MYSGNMYVDKLLSFMEWQEGFIMILTIYSLRRWLGFSSRVVWGSDFFKRTQESLPVFVVPELTSMSWLEQSKKSNSDTNTMYLFHETINMLNGISRPSIIWFLVHRQLLFTKISAKGLHFVIFVLCNNPKMNQGFHISQRNLQQSASTF